MIKFNRNLINQAFRASSSSLSINPNVEVVDSKTNELLVPKIGLEVHAQLKLKSKLFSQGATNQVIPNSKLDLLDVALPGTLPKFNRDALRGAILTSIGLDCSVAESIHFDRKNYFYADMPAGYQITQHNKPIGINGQVEFIAHTYSKSVISHSQPYDLVKYLFFNSRQDRSSFVPYIKRSRIKQIQLEQDSAKTYHQLDDNENEVYCLVDYNRCGTALVEIVFEPDLSSHHEASSLIKELIIILKALDTCDCEMSEGSLRVDANISMQPTSDFNIVGRAEKVELKNLNSVGFVNRALLAEVKRQSELILDGKDVNQETRYFNPRTNTTLPLRLKEDSTDYRYVPEPNIPPLCIEKSLVESIRQDLPHKMPNVLRAQLIDGFNLDMNLVVEVMEEPGLCEYFIKVMDSNANYDADVVADFLIYTLTNLRNISGLSLKVDVLDGGRFCDRLNPKIMQSLLDMIFNEEISYSTGYEVIKVIFTSLSEKRTPKELVDYFGWHQITGSTEIRQHCLELIKNMKNIPKKYKKRGSMKDLRMMLDKLGQLTNNRISIKKAIIELDNLLKPNKET